MTKTIRLTAAQAMVRYIAAQQNEDEKGQCFGLGAYTVYRSSHQFTPHFTITSIPKGHSQNAVLPS